MRACSKRWQGENVDLSNQIVAVCRKNVSGTFMIREKTSGQVLRLFFRIPGFSKGGSSVQLVNPRPVKLFLRSLVLWLSLKRPPDDADCGLLGCFLA